MNSKLLEQKTEKCEIQMLICGGGLRADENWQFFGMWLNLFTSFCAPPRTKSWWCHCTVL